MKQFPLAISLFSLVAILAAQPIVQIEPTDTTAAEPARWAPNPTVAALLSTAIPGAGQIYGRAYWHSPIFIVAEGYCAWRVFDAAQRANEQWDLRNSLTPGTAAYEEARSEFDYAALERNTYLWFLAGVKFLDIADAYVSAHLYEFDEQMNMPLSINVLPAADGAMVSLTVRFYADLHLSK